MSISRVNSDDLGSPCRTYTREKLSTLAGYYVNDQNTTCCLKRRTYDTFVKIFVIPGAIGTKWQEKIVGQFE